MCKARLYYSLIACLLLFGAMSLEATPRLTVVIVADGLNRRSLELMQPYWPQGGLRTLSEEGSSSDIVFPHWVYGGNESMATVLTGALPSEHGWTMDTWFSRSDRMVHLFLEDMQEQGIGSYGQWSPRMILCPTVADRWRMLYGEKARIYAVGIHPQTTVLLAGHSADACCWMDGRHNAWVSTSFYGGGLPAAADAMNMSGRFAEVAGREWMPRMAVSMYNLPTDNELKHGFRYTGTDFLYSSPNADALVVELALSLQEEERMGTDNVPDILMLEMTVSSPVAVSDNIGSAEQEDMYLWFNQHLGYLMEQLDHRIGRQNYQVMLVGRPLSGTDAVAMERAGMPCRAFNVDHAAALTSAYLMAVYGHERWVDGGYGQSIFLNRPLLEQKGMSLETVQRQVANFLMEFEGVQLACPQHEAFLNDGMASSVNKRFAGDVVFTLQPGWKLTYNDKQLLDNVVEMQPTAPLLYWSADDQSPLDDILPATDILKLLLR